MAHSEIARVNTWQRVRKFMDEFHGMDPLPEHITETIRWSRDGSVPRTPDDREYASHILAAAEEDGREFEGQRLRDEPVSLTPVQAREMKFIPENLRLELVRGVNPFEDYFIVHREPKDDLARMNVGVDLAKPGADQSVRWERMPELTREQKAILDVKITRTITTAPVIKDIPMTIGFSAYLPDDPSAYPIQSADRPKGISLSPSLQESATCTTCGEVTDHVPNGIHCKGLAKSRTEKT